MSWFGFVFRNIRFHARANFAILLGSATGAAVLAGALIVGDSLRGSLRDRTDRQLAGTDVVLVTQRFFRAELAERLPNKVTPALLLQGSLRAGTGSSERTVGKVTVLGVDARFGVEIPPIPASLANNPQLTSAKPAVVSYALAKQLELAVGDTLTLGLAKGSSAPKSSFLGERGTDKSTRSIRLVVTAILPISASANDFSLSPSSTVPLNLFISLDSLQAEIEQKGRLNTLLVAGQSAQSLQSEFSQLLEPTDWGLTVEIAPQRKSYITVESQRVFLEPHIVDAVEKTTQEMGLRSTRTLVNLATSISDGKHSIPYSVVAAVDAEEGAPLGPFLPPGVKKLESGQIALIDWKQSPLVMTPNAKITLRYYKTEIEDRVGNDDAIEERETVFTLAGPPIPFEGVVKDRNLAPAFPGITDKKGSIQSWETPFKIPEGVIQQRDEDFWRDYNTTPKAYICLADGQAIWKNRFGELTSIRIAPIPGTSLKETLSEFQSRFAQKLDPKQGGFVFEPIRERMLAAGQGSTDFGMLFLAFSFFLILAALMLVGLLFRLNLDQRAKEIGLLRAAGYSLKTVRRLLLVEGLLVAGMGSGLGLIAAAAYADAMLKLLAALWPSENVGSFLRVHVSPLSLAIGFFASILMSGMAIYWALRLLARISPSALLRGNTTPPETIPISEHGSRRPLGLGLGSLIGAVALALMAPFLPPGEPQAGTFFGAGAFLLTTGLALAWWNLKRFDRRLLSGFGWRALWLFGSRNAKRNPTRSLLTIALIGSAAFLIVAVESFRRQPDRDFLEKTGGSGGFPLIGETSTPVYFDPNEEGGRSQMEFALERWIQNNYPLAERAERLKTAEAMLAKVRFYRFRLQAGDDASCLNLYQATKPRLLGVPHDLQERGGFQFSDSLAKSDEERKNPWLLLHWQPGDAAVPIFVEENSATWMLKKGLGDTLEVADQNGKPFTVRIVGLLKDSVFQSELLLPDEAFRHHFGNTEGFTYFLLETDGDIKEVARWLTIALGNYGFEATATRDRVASFLAVQNTYLTTFQLLGGFGLLLGVVGLAVVLLRSIWERQGELALLRSLGYRRRDLNRIFFYETQVLLLEGLAVGILAALFSVLPHVAEGGHIPWLRLGLMLLIIFLSGLLIAGTAVGLSLRKSLIQALREE